MTKLTTDDRRIWMESAALIGVSAVIAVLTNRFFARYKPKGLPLKPQPAGPPAAPWDKATPEEKAKAEPAKRALEHATAQVDTPEKATQVAKRLEELAGKATTGDVEKAAQPETPGTVADKVETSSQRIEQATESAAPANKAANGIVKAAEEITAAAGPEKKALAEATQETLNPDQEGAPQAEHPHQRALLRQAVLKRMRPLDALDAELFLAVNHLPHNRWLNAFFYFFTFIFTGGAAWYLLMALEILNNPRKGVRALRHDILPLSISLLVVEYPIKAFFRRRRPFIEYIQTIVIGRKPGSWSFPSGHSASAFAGAWLLGRDYPHHRPLFFLLAGIVAFSRIYLGDHYPGDVTSGALTGSALTAFVQHLQRSVKGSRGW